MLPARPPLASLVWTTSTPVDPDTVVPLARCTAPDIPTAIALALRIVTAPLDDTVPDPLTTLTAPPTFPDDVVSPARTATSPPSPLFVVPTLTLIDPASPLTADPVNNSKSPTLPFRV
jgi:hypothetical protein